MKTSEIFKHYIWMIDIFRRHGRLTLVQFNSHWRRCILSNGRDMARSTFNYNRDAIEDIFGLTIECDTRDYAYYIDNVRDLRGNSLQNWLIDTLSIGNLVSESKQLHDRILLDEIPVGGNILTEIMRAMNKSVRIRISYRKFKDAEPKDVFGSPLCIKAFNHRWYVVLDTPDHDEPAVYSLDRIQMVELTSEGFTMPSDFDAATYFRNSFGVFAGKRFPVERVVLKAYGVQCDYLRSLPLHHSQVERERGADWSIFELRIRPTFDFKQELLSHGSAIEVLSPESLRSEMRDEIKRMALSYES